MGRTASARRRLYARSTYGLGALTVVAHLVAAVSVAAMTVDAGGSVARAPKALALMSCGLFACGVCAGAVHGLRGDRRAAIGEAFVAAAAFYAATWRFTSAHSIAGDTGMMVLAGIPISLSATLGWRGGAVLRRRAGRISS